MHSKKIAAVVLTLGIGIITFLSFSQLRIKHAFADSIKQNVVYTKSNAPVLYNNNDKVYKLKTSEALKKYFNQSPETNKNAYYYTVILNEKGLNKWEAAQLKAIEDEFKKNQISSVQYNKQNDDIKKQHEASKATISKLKHGVIQATWIDEKEVYIVFFNENTEEVEYALWSKPHDKLARPLESNETQLKNIAEDYIKQNKLDDIKNPKFITFSGKNYHQLFYQEAKDSSKKAYIVIDPYTNKVSSFAVKAYADMFYNEIIK